VTQRTAQAVAGRAKAMGTNNLKCVTHTGSGYVGLVGQNFDIRDDWARVELASYTRTINFDEKSAREERVLRQGNYPTRGGGGIPLQGEQRQIQFVADKFAWNLQGTNTVPAPAAAEVRQLDLWLNPHGFIKAAMAPGANPVLITRYESGALGGLSSAVQRKLNIISFTALGDRVNGTINDQNPSNGRPDAEPVRATEYGRRKYCGRDAAGGNFRATSIITPTGTTRRSRRTITAATIH
jgi:hypothetical protein